MPRRPGVYFYRGWWCTKAGCGNGPPHKLIQAKGKSDRESKRQAEELLRKLLVKRDEHHGHVQPVSQITVAELVGKFLDRTEVECSVFTYRDYRTELRKLVEGFPWLYLKRKKRDDPGPRWEKGTGFVDGLGSVRVRDVTLEKAETLRNALVRHYKPKTANHWLIACKACWNWGLHEQRQYVAVNPFNELPLLPCPDRQRVMTREEFELLWHHSDDLFRDVLLFLRLTPSRPSVVRLTTWPMVQWECCQILLPHHQTKKGRQAKVRQDWRIPLVPEVVAMLRRRYEHCGGSPFVFLNEDGNPWTKDALVLRMRRLRERAGLKPDEQGEQLVLYSNRHTYLTKAAPNVSAPLLGALADQTDPRTTRRYLHHSPQEILEAGLKAAQNLK